MQRRSLPSQHDSWLVSSSIQAALHLTSGLPDHSNRIPLNSFGMTGVIWTCTSHSWPVLRGRTGMYWSESANLMGSRPSFTTFPNPTPSGTVQISPAGAFQFARMLPEYPTLQPSPKNTVAMGYDSLPLFSATCYRVLPAA